MWALVDNSKVGKIYTRPLWLKDASGTSHPPSTFKNSATLASFKIYPVVITNSPMSNTDIYREGGMTYSWKSSKKIVEATHSYSLKAMEDVNSAWTQTEIEADKAPAGTKKGDAKLDDRGYQVVILGIRSILINKIKNQESSLLKQTDKWIIRKSEKSTDVPSTVTTWRDGIRSKAIEMETAITNAADSDAILVLLRTTYDNDHKLITSAILYDFPIAPEGMPR
jgi:hypothetical protein